MHSAPPGAQLVLGPRPVVFAHLLTVELAPSASTTTPVTASSSSLLGLSAPSLDAEYTAWQEQVAQQAAVAVEAVATQDAAHQAGNTVVSDKQ